MCDGRVAVIETKRGVGVRKFFYTFLGGTKNIYCIFMGYENFLKIFIDPLHPGTRK